MGKSKAGGSQSQSQKREFSMDEEDVGVSNDNEETAYTPSAKKRKVDLKHKNGTGSLAAYGASLKVSLKKAEQEDDEEDENGEEERPATPVPVVARPKPVASSSTSVSIIDGNCAERIKDASLCRKRQQTKPFQIDKHTPQPKRNNSVVITNGNGTKFRNIPFLVQKINNALTAELETIHKVIFGKKATHSLRKQNLMSFSGFAFARDSKEYAKKKDELTKLEKPDREFVCEWFGLSKSGAKENVVNSILEFLMAPSADHVNEVAKSPERKSASPKKEPKSTAAAVASPSPKKSPAKAKASPKKKVAPKFSKPKQAKKSASPASKSPKKKSPTKASPKTISKKSPKKKASAVVKPVFKAKSKKKSKDSGAPTPASEEDEIKVETEISSDSKHDEEPEVRDDAVDSGGSLTKTKKKPDFKKQPKKGKGKTNNTFASQPIEEEEDQDVVSTTSRTQ